MIFFLKKCSFSLFQNFKQTNAGIACYDFFNLKQKSRLFLRNVYRHVSIANPQISKDDVNKLLKHLHNAYTLGEKTYFQELLTDKVVKNLINEKISILENLENLTKLGEEDQELKNLANEEKISNENRLVQIDNALIDIAFENLDKDICNNIILEISAGVGGQESMLFVKDLLDMYVKHVEYLGYSFNITELDEVSLGGYRYVSLMISGEGCLNRLQHEAGVHRVQRVPTTEKSGRLHTSVVSVAVLRQPDEVEVYINPKDLRIDTMKASGAGGQHVNTTDSAVRITHLPTGIVVVNQTERSQTKNRNLAMIKLRTKIYNTEFQKEQNQFNMLRKQQMGMGERNEKIRTYNFNQDRITDHRLSDGTLFNVKGFLSGGKPLENLHVKLQKQLQNKLLQDIINNL